MSPAPKMPIVCALGTTSPAMARSQDAWGCEDKGWSSGLGVLIGVGGFKCRRAFLGEGVLLACRLPVKDTDKCFAFARHA
jgi:hypothetical protein